MRVAALVSGALLLTACVAGPPPDMFVVTPQLLQQRQLETRKYEGIKEADLIAACSNVLQDLGFNLENSEVRLGVLTAGKQRDAVNAGEVALAVVVAVLGGGLMPISKDQTIRVALVIRPVIDSRGKPMQDSFLARVTFQRIVRRTDNSLMTETLSDPELYKSFFDKVSKSVFIEGQKL